MGGDNSSGSAPAKTETARDPNASNKATDNKKQHHGNAPPRHGGLTNDSLRDAAGRKSVRVAFLSVVIILGVVFGVMPHTNPLQGLAAWAFRIAIALLAGLAAGALTGTIGVKNSIIRATGGAAFAVFVLVTSTQKDSGGAGAVTAAPPAPMPPTVMAKLPTLAFDARAMRRSIDRWSELLLSTRGSKGGFRCARFGARPEQPWTTAQVLTGYLAKSELTATDANMVSSGLGYLTATRLPGGGWPLWENGKLAITEIGAWVTLARVRALGVPDVVPARQRDPLIKEVRRELAFIVRQQVASGAWAPVAINSAANICTYSTIMAVWALLEATESNFWGDKTNVDTELRLAINWLLNEAYSDELGGWVPRPPARHARRYTGLTAQTLMILLHAKDDRRFAYLRQSDRLKRAVSAFFADSALLSRDATDNDTVDGEDAVMNDAGFSIEGSTFLWIPWTMVLAARVVRDADFSTDLQAKARGVFEHVVALSSKVDFENQGTYWAAEYTICGAEAATLMSDHGTDR